MSAQTTSDASRYESVKIKATVLDAKTSEPIPYVSVYLIPEGDTTITNFAVSDRKEKVVMDNVVSGQYGLYAEYIGYLTFRKKYAISSAPRWDLDLGTIGMEESKEEQMQGISTSIGKETVMDVEIKDEYKKGWFGNAKLGGGAALSGDKGNPLKKGAKGLYEGNIMLSGYGEKDQTVLIANAFNTATSDAGNTSAAIQEDDFTSIGGLMSAVQAGANYNTGRIKHFETTVSATYKHTAKDDKKRFSRTSFAGADDDILTGGGSDIAGKEDLMSIALEMSKHDGKLLADIQPSFNFRKSSINSSNFSTVSDAGFGAMLNSLSATSPTGKVSQGSSLNLVEKRQLEAL